MTPGDAQNHPHIEVRREQNYDPLRRKSGRGSGPQRPADRRSHGEGIRQQVAAATTHIEERRRALGVDPANLLVLEFQANDVDVTSIFESRFGLGVVGDSRTPTEGGGYRYTCVVQFPSPEDLTAFRAEIDRYLDEDTETSILPPGKRRDFFDALDVVRSREPQDRLGPLIREEGFPTGSFYSEAELWHPGDDDRAVQIIETIAGICREGGGDLRGWVKTPSLLVAKIWGTEELIGSLLELDTVSMIDLPATIETSYADQILAPSTPPQISPAQGDEPRACVLDSGVISGHPYLAGWVLAEEDFDTGEGTPVDQNGHGTGVAGIVLYGDVAECISSGTWNPAVQICSAKIMRHDTQRHTSAFPPENLFEDIIERAVRYFHDTHGCRVFNLSVASRTPYAGGRQGPWAEKIDQLAREMDIVFVLCTGNTGLLPVPDTVMTAEDLFTWVQEQRREASHRISSPATAALGITVGSVARSHALVGGGDGAVELPNAVAGAPRHGPSPFSRTGPGYANGRSTPAVKPELVGYGGNAAIVSDGAGTRWHADHPLLGEPTIRPERDGRLLTTLPGTSFAAPQITHAAAHIEAALEEQFGRPPSANLIRAVLGLSASLPSCDYELFDDEASQLIHTGYGMCDLAMATRSADNTVFMLAEDVLEDEHMHIYRFRIPEEFLAERGVRGLSVALAFDPPTKVTRRDYLARTMEVDVFRGLTSDEVQQYRGRWEGQRAQAPKIPSKNGMTLRPTKTAVARSTLQVRRTEWRQRPPVRVPTGEDEATVHVVVTSRQQFPTGDPYQRYALGLCLWHENDRLDIYSRMQTRVNLRTPRLQVVQNAN